MLENGSRTITDYVIHLWSWNFIHLLPMSQGCALLILGSKGQRSRSWIIDVWKWFPDHNWLCNPPMIMKLHTLAPHESRMCPIDFGVKRSKVKVMDYRCLKMVSGTITDYVIHLCSALEFSKIFTHPRVSKRWDDTHPHNFITHPKKNKWRSASLAPQKPYWNMMHVDRKVPVHTLQLELSFLNLKMFYFKIKSTKMQPCLTKKPWECCLYIK